MPAEIAVTPETPGRGVGPTVAAGSPDDNRPCFRLALLHRTIGPA